MSRLNIHARNFDLTPAIKDAVLEKMERVCSHFDFIQSIDVHLSVQKNPRISDAHLAEVLVHVSGGLLKTESHSGDLYMALDVLVDKVMRNLTKYKQKRLGRTKAERSQGGESMRLHGSDALRTHSLTMLDDEFQDFEIHLEVENEAAAFAEAELLIARSA
jgi:ribosomal subunit interface protein